MENSTTMGTTTAMGGNIRTVRNWKAIVVAACMEANYRIGGQRTEQHR